MKIIKKGTFDGHGWPNGWNIDLENPPSGLCTFTDNTQQNCMIFLDADGSVFVHGIEIVEWSNERRKAMGIE